MNKLIKINNHYYIVDDSEIKEGDWYICLSSMHPKKCVKCDNNKNSKWVEDYLGNQDQLKFSNKITHSTQEGIGEQLNLNDIEELVNGYSIREMAEIDAHLVWNDETTFENEQRELNGHIIGFIEGFKAHKELSKDKLNLLLGKLNHKYQDEKDYDT